MQNTNTQTNTIRKVIFTKISHYMETHTLNQIAWRGTELILGLFLGVLIVVPNKVLEALAWGATIDDSAIPKLAAFSFLFFWRKQIAKTLHKYARKIELHKAINERDSELIEGIPAVELCDYLIRNRHFKREGVNGVRATFALNMEKYSRLAQRLEQSGILIRGENNGRILDEKWSRQALISKLENKPTELGAQFTIHRIGYNKIRLMNDQLNAA